MKNIHNLIKAIDEQKQNTNGNIDITPHFILSYLLQQQTIHFHHLAKQTAELAVQVINKRDKWDENRQLTSRRSDNNFIVLENIVSSIGIYALKAFIDDVIEEINHRSRLEPSALLQLLYIRTIGLHFVCQNKLSTNEYTIGMDLTKEVRVFYQLAMFSEALYPLQTMHFLAHYKRGLFDMKLNEELKQAPSSLFSNLEQQIQLWCLKHENKRDDYLATNAWPRLTYTENDPAAAFAGLIYYDLENPPLSISSKQVAKLRLFLPDTWCVNEKKDDVFSHTNSETLLYIRWHDGSKVVKQISSQYVSQAESLFKKLGAT